MYEIGNVFMPLPSRKYFLAALKPPIQISSLPAPLSNQIFVALLKKLLCKKGSIKIVDKKTGVSFFNPSLPNLNSKIIIKSAVEKIAPLDKVEKIEKATRIISINSICLFNFFGSSKYLLRRSEKGISK